MLQQVLEGIQVYQDSNVLVGYEQADDGGVYRLNDGLALVQTVDFFTPVVDDPLLYGQIAAANALSDIYAMGGTPRFALSIVGFPEGILDRQILREIIQGGTEKMNSARVPVIGGHSVQDREIKFGYCVTGVVDPEKIFTNRGAQAGDVLILTKPLGTGIVATGIKFQKASPEMTQEAIRWMLMLNGPCVEPLKKLSVHSMTDITGYGLLGHAWEMARASQVTLTFKAGALPVLKGVPELIRRGMLPGGIGSNRRYVGDGVSWGSTPEFYQQIMLDPQTSGGLLVSLPEDEARFSAAELEAVGFLAQKVGQVGPAGTAAIEVYP